MIFALLGRSVHDLFKYELLSMQFFKFLIVIFVRVAKQILNTRGVEAA